MIASVKYRTTKPRVLLVDTFGGIAVTSLLICVISGLIIAIPYDISKPYLSISNLMLSSAGAVIARNMHYWSAQFFLVFTVLHIWDHLSLGTEKDTRAGLWFRLLISMFMVFYAMLSGFILKGDADSSQALLIFNSLFAEIPIIGKYIAYVLLGNENNLILVYVNHISLATVFIFLILFEHARVIWGRSVSFIILALVLFVLSILFQAPLHDGQSGVVKGPWYFLGLQEMLHWMRQPGWIWVITALILIPVFFLPVLKSSKARIIKYFLFLALVFYIILSIIGYFFRGEQWKWAWQGASIVSPFNPVPIMPGTFSDFPVEVTGYERAESCLLCHDGMEGFSSSHDPAAIGCVSCHQGNPFTPDKDLAHSGMIYVPGNLVNADRSCGTAQCHPEITRRINTGLMATNSGIVAVDRFVFGEAESPDGFYHIMDIGHSPADQHMRNMCARCHLGNFKYEPGPISEGSRGGGCNACHLNYSAKAHSELLKYYGISMQDSSLWKTHPSLDLNISNDHCFGCHSRSGRISTSYEGWHETLLNKDEIQIHDSLRILDDGRVFRYIAEDVHNKAGLLCIDCHGSYELMGDGTFYMHEEDQVRIRCEDCHFNRQPNVISYEELDAETRKILQLKGIMKSSGFLLGDSGCIIWNSKIDISGEPLLFGKLDNRDHPLNPPAAICTKGDAHDGLGCRSCHTSWVPQCIGCHNDYDPKLPGYDMIEQKEVEGSWVEYVALYLADQPTLGVVMTGREKSISTFTPGMILSIDKTAYDATAKDPHIFHRLYAPISAHTTVSQGRSCRSCHNDPLAIGYGRGILEYDLSSERGKWIFTPRFAANKFDGLPEDAWIPFLGEGAKVHSTRTNTRPFTIEEQKRILLAGSCLVCHDEDSEIMLSTLDDFDAAIHGSSSKCILPDYYLEDVN